jgi:hypothetical protein
VLIHFNRKRLISGAFFLIFFSFYCYLVYPGLKGGFVLDDLPNLSPLKAVKSTGDIQSFVFNGISSFLGRPLALFTFALQAEHWPQNPEPFKWVGLLLHLVNAFLIGLCSATAARLLGASQRAQLIISAGITFFWLFQASHISTVFYVVQRMTLLSAFFSLVALYGFLRGLGHKDSLQGLGWATLLTGIGYIAGILAKENAVLLGFYIAVLYVFIRPRIVLSKQLIKYWDYWVIIFALVPPISILGYLLLTLPEIAYNFRSFTLFERLITQNIILFKYLWNVFFPTPAELNIFNDEYPFAKGLLSPIWALLALISWVFLLVFSLRFWKKYALFAFAIFWYLAGHSLESSFWPLELYFEHRNYLPSIGPIVALVCISYYAKDSQSNIKKWALWSILGISFIFNILTNSVEIRNWSSPGGLAISALTDRPYSLRARQEAAAFFANTGDFATSTGLLHSIEKEWPGFTGPYSQLRMLYCFDENIKLPIKSEFEGRLTSGSFDRITVKTWHQIFNFIANNQCENLSQEKFRHYVQQLLNNSNYKSVQDDLLILLAFSYNTEKKYQLAAQTLDQLPEDQSHIDYFILKAKFYAVAGLEKEALDILTRAEVKFKPLPRVWLANRASIKKLTAKIKQKESGSIDSTRKT